MTHVIGCKDCMNDGVCPYCCEGQVWADQWNECQNCGGTGRCPWCEGSVQLEEEEAEQLSV